MLEVLNQTLYVITHFYLNTIQLLSITHINSSVFILSFCFTSTCSSFPAIYFIALFILVIYLTVRYFSALSFLQFTFVFFTLSLIFLHFTFLHSHHLHHHNIHLVTQHQDRLTSRSVLKSLHPRQREPCGRDRSFLDPPSTDKKSG